MQGHYPPATVVIDRVAAWFEEHGQPDRPLFLWVHLMDTHSPYLPPAPWRDRFAPPATRDVDDLEANDVLYHFIFEQQDAKKKAADYPLPEDLGLDLRSLERHWHGLYHGETAYADAEIGRLRDVLERAGVWDDAVVVVTSDHGEEFGEHGRVAHNRRSAMAEELIRVPLVVRPPTAVAATGTEVDTLVRMVDIAPTILDLVGAGDATIAMDGRTLRPLLEGRPDDPRTALISGIWWGIAHDGRWKYRLEKPTWTGGDAVERLFDVERDPLETTDIAGDRPDVLERLRSEWDRGAERLRQRADTDVAGDGGELDEATREQLEALGYLTGGTDPTPTQ
jgi:arylsulfatase A-like enzyme